MADSMRNPNIIIGLVLLLTLVSVAFSFSVNNFLYSNENASMVSYENFTQNNISYSVVKINNKETFLLKSGTEMLNETEIANVLRLYYKSKYYPTQTEINNITNLIKIYNQSRTDGDAKEEQFCMVAQLKVDGSTIVEGKKRLECVDNASCEFAAQLVYAKWYSGAFESWQKYLSYMRPFATASYGTSTIVNNSLHLIENANEETLYGAIVYLKNAMPNLTKYKIDIETSVFRSPNKGESCKVDKCTGICPPLDLNDTAFTALNNSVNALESKLAPFAKYKNSSSYIANSTKTRIDFHVAENKADYYTSVFEPLKDGSDETIGRANNISAYIVNNSLKVKIELLNQLASKINKSITDRNFTTTEADLEDYEELINSTNNGINATAEVYNISLEVNRENTAKLVILGSKEIGGDDALLFNELSNKSKELDDKFWTNLTVDEHLGLISNYTSISSQLSEITGHQQDSLVAVVMNNFKRASYRAGDNLFEGIKAGNIMSEKDVTQNKFYIVFGFSALAFISLSAILVLVVAMRLIRKNINTMRATLYAIGSFAVITLFFIFGGLLYYFLDKATVTSDAEVWLGSFWNSEKNLSLILDTKNVSTNDSTAMRNCAELLASAIEQHNNQITNKSISFYEFDDNCTVGLNTQVALNATLNKTECLNMMNNTEMITFSYSAANNTIEFPSLIEKSVIVTGNDKWYKTCAIAKVMVS